MPQRKWYQRRQWFYTAAEREQIRREKRELDIAREKERRAREAATDRGPVGEPGRQEGDRSA